MTLHFTGFRNDLGEALIFIYPTPLGFPEEDAPDLIHLHQPIHNQQVQVTIDKLPYHSYAVAVLHDENMNGQMDKSLVSFPTEGFGFSRNPKPLLGPPKYQDARFLLISQAQEQAIELQYPTMKKLRQNRPGPPADRLKY